MSLNSGAGFVVGQSISTAARLLYEVPATLELQRQQFEARLALDRDHLAHEHQKWVEQRRDARIKAEAERRQRLEEIVKTAEFKLILDNWPLKIAPSAMMRIDDPTPPPYILLALPPSMSERLIIEEEVRTVLDTYYAFGSSLRPVEFLGASWSNHTRVSEIIKQMATVLASEPTLVVEVEEIMAGQLRVRLGFWGTLGKEYTYRSIAKLPWPGAGSDDGILGSSTNASYLSICLSVIIANFADGYHRLYRGVAPLLPSLLPSFLEPLVDPAAEEIRSVVESSYAALFRRVAAEEPASEPDILLELSEVFAALGDIQLCRQQVLQSVETWARLRGLEVGPLSGTMDVLLKSAKAEDRPYLEKLERALNRLSESGASDIRNMLESWPASKQRPLVLRPTLVLPRGSDRIWQPSTAKAHRTAPKKPTRKTFL